MQGGPTNRTTLVIIASGSAVTVVALAAVFFGIWIHRKRILKERREEEELENELRRGNTAGVDDDIIMKVMKKELGGTQTFDRSWGSQSPSSRGGQSPANGDRPKRAISSDSCSGNGSKSSSGRRVKWKEDMTEEFHVEAIERPSRRISNSSQEHRGGADEEAPSQVHRSSGSAPARGDDVGSPSSRRSGSSGGSAPSREGGGSPSSRRSGGGSAPARGEGSASPSSRRSGGRDASEADLTEFMSDAARRRAQMLMPAQVQRNSRSPKGPGKEASSGHDGEAEEHRGGGMEHAGMAGQQKSSGSRGGLRDLGNAECSDLPGSVGMAPVDRPPPAPTGAPPTLNLDDNNLPLATHAPGCVASSGQDALDLERGTGEVDGPRPPPTASRRVKVKTRRPEPPPPTKAPPPLVHAAPGSPGHSHSPHNRQRRQRTAPLPAPAAAVPTRSKQEGWPTPPPVPGPRQVGTAAKRLSRDSVTLT